MKIKVNPKTLIYLTLNKLSCKWCPKIHNLVWECSMAASKYLCQFKTNLLNHDLFGVNLEVPNNVIRNHTRLQGATGMIDCKLILCFTKKGLTSRAMIFSNSVLSTFSPPAAALAFSTSSDILQITINDFFCCWRK